MEQLKQAKRRKTPDTYLLIIAAIIGLATGLGAVGFRYLIQFFHNLAFDGGKTVFSFLEGNYVILLPALGGLIVGPLTYFFAREAKGHGVPEVMAAVALNNGRLRPRVVLVKSFASAICIGTGGSVGREGPIVQIGSAIGSTIGQLSKLPANNLRALVACGAAGGIAATFNAPIGGVLFAMEVILGNFTGGNLMLVIISSVTSAIVGRVIMGDIPAFSVPAYPLHSPYELLLYVLLGLICGIFAVVYIKILYKFEDVFDAIKFKEYLKPVLGGLIVGIIGLFYPHIFGVGYESIDMALAGEISLSLLVILVFLKLLATSITIGSGGSGGVFAPGLFIGAMLGGCIGIIFHHIFPTIAAIPAAYALVGMGAVFAGSAQAPITAILILFEMSNDYRIILPLMIACVISVKVAGGLYSENIYTVKLVRRGLDIVSARRPDILKNYLVMDFMTINTEIISADLTIEKAYELVYQSHHQGFPIVTQDNTLKGIVTIYELGSAIKEGKASESVVEILSPNPVVVVKPDDTLSEVARKLNRFDIGRLPVVSSDEPKKLVGLITRSDVISAYSRESLKSKNEKLQSN